MQITFMKVSENDDLRYYEIHDRQKHLFTPFSYTAVWGPHPGKGRSKSYSFDTRREMDEHIQKTIAKRVKEGYKVLYHYLKKSRFSELTDYLDEMSC